MSRGLIFARRREMVAKANRRKVATNPGQWYFDSVNQQFYQKTVPDYAVPEAEFSQRFYFPKVGGEDRADHDPAYVIKSLPQAEVHGRIFDQPDNPANVIERDGLRFVNVRQNYYDAMNERCQKQTA